MPGADQFAEEIGVKPERSMIGPAEIGDETAFHPCYREWLRLIDAGLRREAPAARPAGPRNEQRVFEKPGRRFPLSRGRAARRPALGRVAGPVRAGLPLWVPAWKADHELVDDPDTGLSFIYYDSRGGLEDRVWRARSGTSVASTPLPRTCHQVTNVRCDEAGPERLLARSAWSCHVFDLRTQQQRVFFGRYEHVLAAVGGELCIAQKKVVLLNDVIDGYIDFYCL